MGGFSPRLKVARYSKELPPLLAERAERARSDPKLLSLQDEIALLEAREAELMTQVETGESGAAWQAISAAVAAFRRALGAGDMAGMTAAFETIEQVAAGGAGAQAIWQEIAAVQDLRRKLSSTEIKTLQALHQMVTVEQLQLYLMAVTQTVTVGVQRYADAETAQQILAYIHRDLTKLANLERR